MKEKVVEYTNFKRSILSRYGALQEVCGFTKVLILDYVECEDDLYDKLQFHNAMICL